MPDTLVRWSSFLLLPFAVACSRAQGIAPGMHEDPATSAAGSSSTGVVPENTVTTPDPAPAPPEPPGLEHSRPPSLLDPANPALALPWDFNSTQIAIRSFGFWDGSSRFEASRSELTPTQLTALDGLRQIPTPTSGLGADFVSYVITISDQSGSVTYRAAQENVRDSDEADLTRPTIDITTLEPFLDTFHCVSAGDTRGLLGSTPEFAADAGTPVNWSQAPLVSTATPGCFHGIFAPYECADIWLRLQVDVPGAYLISAPGCFEQLAISVLSPDGSSELAAAAGVANACPALRHLFAEAGTYPLLLHKSNLAGCSAGGTAGDFYLRVSAATLP